MVFPLKRIRPFLIEIAWLLGSWAFSWLLLGRFLGYNYLLRYESLDIQMHNTYFVVSKWVVTVTLFLLLATIVTGLRVLVQAFRHFGPNVVLVALVSIWSLTALLVAAAWALH